MEDTITIEKRKVLAEKKIEIQRDYDILKEEYINKFTNLSDEYAQKKAFLQQKLSHIENSEKELDKLDIKKELIPETITPEIK